VGDCWNLDGLGPYKKFMKIPKKSQRPIHLCKEGMWELFSPTLLVKVEVAILKYGSPLQFLKSSMRRRKRSLPARARSLASTGEAWMCGTYVNGSPKSSFSTCGGAAPFCSFYFWLLSLQVCRILNDLGHDHDTRSG
jgi:hypothetical protein